MGKQGNLCSSVFEAQNLETVYKYQLAKNGNVIYPLEEEGQKWPCESLKHNSVTLWAQALHPADK